MKKKLDYIFKRLKEYIELKDIKRGQKKERKKERKIQRKEELKIIANRAAYLKASLKANEDGVEKYILKWKEVEIGDYVGQGHPQVAINNILTHKYKDNLLNVLIKKDTPSIASPCMTVSPIGVTVEK